MKALQLCLHNCSQYRPNIDLSMISSPPVLCIYHSLPPLSLYDLQLGAQEVRSVFLKECPLDYRKILQWRFFSQKISTNERKPGF